MRSQPCHECASCHVKRNLKPTCAKDAVLIRCVKGHWANDLLYVNVLRAQRACDDYRQAEDELWQGEW